MRRAPTLLPAFVLLLATPTQAEISPWFEMSAPAGVFAAAGLTDSLEPAFALLTLIRVSHATPQSEEAARIRSAVETALVDPAPARIDLPLPLPAATFAALLPGRTAAERLFPALIRDRRASLFYYGTMAMDPETRAFIASQPGLARGLAGHAGAVAAFGRSIRVARGRLVMPGGEQAAAAWEELVGESAGNTASFLQRLLSVRNGRTAYLFDTVAHLDPPRQRFALASLRGLHRAFTDIDPEWSISTTPFVRPMHDAALLLRLVPVDETGAARAGMWRNLWDAAVESDDLPRRPERTFRRVTEGPRIDAGWLADSIALTPAPVRRRRYEQFAFGARRFAVVDAAAAPEVAVALRGFDRYPALMLALERMGVRAPAVYVAAARRAQALAEVGSPGASVTATAQFQGVVAILDRAARSGRLAPAAVESLVRSLSAVATDGGYGGRLAAWIDETLLPALGASGDSPAERAVLTAIADRSPDADGRRIDLEDIPYVVDYGAGEIARFEQVRARQRGNRLEAVLDLAREVRANGAASRPLRRLEGEATRIGALVRALDPPRDWMGLPGSAPSIDGAPLGGVVDHALAEVLVALAYTPHQGDPAELFAAAADLFHRHDFGPAASGVTAAARARLPWARPRVQDTPGQQTRVTGSLLGLELALARLAVRRLTADRMPVRPRLNRNDREVFMATAAFVNPRALTDADMQALATALRDGRSRLDRARSDAAALDALAVEAGVSAVRRHLLSWLARRAPARVDEVFSRPELLRLAGVRPDDAWGVVAEPLTGCYCLAFPDGSPWEDFSGRPGAGHVASRVPDLALRLAELFVEIAAPAALLPPVLAYATQDFVDEAPSMHPDDWHALVRQAGTLDRLRVEDYLAAVAARGPLRPVDRP